MGTPGPTPDVTLDDVLGVFTDQRQLGTPLTASELAGEVGCSRRTAHRKLDQLSDRGDLETKKVGAHGRVWWRPITPAGSMRTAQLERDSAQFSNFVGAVEDYAIFMLDPNGTVTSWNAGAERIKGYEKDEILGEHFSNFYPDTDRNAGVPQSNLDAASSAGRVEDEGWRLRKDGSRFWANVVITAIHDDAGELLGFTKVTRDMTERREYEQQLRQERNLSNQIIETVPVSISVLSPDGEFIQMNQRTAERLGLDSAALDDITPDAWDLYDADGNVIPPDDRPWRTVADTGEPIVDYECQVDLPDLGRRWISINATPATELAEDDDFWIVYSVDDITSQKERERQLRRERNQTEELLRTAPIAISVHDADGETVLANERARDLPGLFESGSSGDSLHRDSLTVYDATGQQIQPAKTPTARVHATGEAVFDEVLAIEATDGDRRWVSMNAVPILTAAGELDRVITACEDITDLKRRERQLVHRRDLLTAELDEVYERVDEAFFSLDETWTIDYTNEKARSVFRAAMAGTNDSIEGIQVGEVLPDNLAETVLDQFEVALETQTPVTLEEYYEPLDTWLEVRAYPSETGLSIYVRDVSDRISRERELEKYETIVETVQDGVYTVNPEGHFTMINDAYTEMIGYTRDELLGIHVSNIVDEETIETAQTLERELDEREQATLEADMITADGGTIRAEASFSLIPTGNDHERVGVVRDITDRKERERELETRARQQRDIADIGRYALEEPTLDELFTEACTVVSNVLDMDYCKVLDLDAGQEELLLRQGCGWRDGLVGIATVSSIDAESQAAYTLGSEQPIVVEDLGTETRFSGPDLLTDHDVTSGISTIIGSADAPWGILGTHDTRKRSFSEEDVNFLQSIANILAAAIERHRYQNELQATIEKLEQSNERLEQFAYVASHDLQEPLRMVSNYLQLIERRYADDLDEDGREFIDYAVDGATRMREMINGLLAYSRVDTEAEPLEPTDCDDIIESVRQTLRMQLEDNDVDLTVDSLPTITADQNQLEQVFQNLISNAIKYRDDHQAQIEIGAEQRGDEWVFHVDDNGIGIDPDHQDRIFEVFKRLHTNEEYSGTGIGLALCQKIVERHGGRIWVESTPGEGSTFSFTIPQTEGDHA